MCIIEQTPYEYSLEANIRILDLDKSEEKWYFEHAVTKQEFLQWLNSKELKPNSTPRKTLPYLEYRMYGLVPYNISPIQAAIQYGHALQEYNNLMWHTNVNDDIVTGFRKWADEDKTFIILNGGTTNENEDSRFYGSLQSHRDLLDVNDVLFAQFREPDLNNTLTAVVFLVDERVFNRELYPDYVNVPYPWEHKGRRYEPREEEMDRWDLSNQENYVKWVEKIGGEKNAFLRTHLRGLRLANN